MADPAPVALVTIPADWWIAALPAAFLMGFAKTGVPGVGNLAVPLMAAAFGARLSLGISVPLLIVGDIMAVIAYRSHADWPIIRQLTPSVVLGVVVGTGFLWYLGGDATRSAWLNPIVGVILLGLLGLTLLRQKQGDAMPPLSAAAGRAAGGLAGFTTMVANAAGPIMQLYLSASGLPKDRLMGTAAVYFFLINSFKIPFLIFLTFVTPRDPVMTLDTLRYSAMMAPLVVLGGLIGRRIYPHIPEATFTKLILILSAVVAVRLLFL